MRRESGETRGRWRVRRAAEPEEENAADKTTDPSEPTGGHETKGHESPQAEAGRPRTPGDAFDQVLRDAAEARAERGDDEN